MEEGTIRIQFNLRIRLKQFLASQLYLESQIEWVLFRTSLVKQGAIRKTIRMIWSKKHLKPLKLDSLQVHPVHCLLARLVLPN